MLLSSIFFIPKKKLKKPFWLQCHRLKLCLLSVVITITGLVISWNANAAERLKIKTPAMDINTCTDLQNIKNNLSSQSIVTGDINCDYVAFSPLNTITTHPFTGNFDSAGYRIQIDSLIENYPDRDIQHNYATRTIKGLNTG